MKYSCVIIEKVSYKVTNLHSILKFYFPEIQVLAVFESFKESLVQIQDLCPKIVFLDAKLVDSTNEMTLRDLTQNFYVIFMSFHVENTAKAVKNSAFDFLLKPIQRQELSRVVRKILWQENKRLRSQIISLSYPGSIESMDNKVAIPSSDGIHLFPINSIVRLKAERNYTRIHFSNRESLLTSKTLKSYEETLPNVLFQRVHQSHVLNLSKIKSYINKDGGYLLMEDGSTVTVSTRKKHEILEYLKGKV